VERATIMVILGRARSRRSEAYRAILFVCCVSITGAGLAQTTPELPNAPEPHLQRTPSDQKPPDNTQEGTAEKTKKVTVEAAQATIHMGEVAVVHARNWESRWLTGVYISQGQTPQPLTFAERRDLYLQQTLTTPGAYAKRMFAAGVDQLRDNPPQWDDGWAGYAERLASREGQFISANTLAMLGNAALKYEPRYEQCSCRGFWRRSGHAIVRNFVTYNQSEQKLRPQLGLYAGALGGGMISAAWKSNPHNVFVEGALGMAGQAGYGALWNFFLEFYSDFNRKIGARTVPSPGP
jgi:hypothetical protein